MLWDDTEKTKHFSIYFGIDVHSVNAIILSCLLEIGVVGIAPLLCSVNVPLGDISSLEFRHS